jgi:hypothetical protein
MAVVMRYETQMRGRTGLRPFVVTAKVADVAGADESRRLQRAVEALARIGQRALDHQQQPAHVAEER